MQSKVKIIKIQIFSKSMSAFHELQKESLFEANSLSDHSLDISLDSKILIQKVKASILVFVILIGIIGNILNLMVFAKQSMRKISTFQFLLFLSINNIIVLLIGASDVLLNNIVPFEIRNFSNAFCKLHTYITYISTHSASLIMVAVNIERAFLINNLNSHKHKNMSKTISMTNNKTSEPDLEMVFVKKDSCKKRFDQNRQFYFTKNNRWLILIKQRLPIVSIISITAFACLFNIHYLIFLKLVSSVPSETNDKLNRKIVFMKNSIYKNSSMFIKIQKMAEERLSKQDEICFAAKVKCLKCVQYF